jgi:hypothetical protein
VISQVVSGLALWLCGYVTGWILGRRTAYRDAARSVWPEATGTDTHAPLPTAELPPASRRAIKRQQRANRADLRKAFRR